MGIFLNVGLAALAYAFPVDKPLTYSVSLTLQGLTVFGVDNSKAEADLVLAVQGLSPTDQGPRLSYDLKDIEVLFNDNKIPLPPDSTKAYFPKTTITINPQGKVLKTDAPDVQLPIRLPGLDVKRFPEITFLAVEFPPDPIEVGKPWTTSKMFGDSPVTEQLTPTNVSPDKIDLDITIDQAFDSMEDAGRGIPKNPADAVAKVHTVMHGTGKATFDPVQGVLVASKIQADSISTVTDIKSNAVSTRKLHTDLDVKLNSPTNGAPAPIKPPDDKQQDYVSLVKFYWKLALMKATPMVAEMKQFVAGEIAYLKAQLVKQ
jgi:hypothetical protein